MGKVLAIIFLIVFAWFAVPRIAQAQWFAPTAYPSYWWGAPVYSYPQQVHNRGWGWFSVGFGGGSVPGYISPGGYVSGYIPPTGGFFGNAGWGQGWNAGWNGGWGAFGGANVYNGYIW